MDIGFVVYPGSEQDIYYCSAADYNKYTSAWYTFLRYGEVQFPEIAIPLTSITSGKDHIAICKIGEEHGEMVLDAVPESRIIDLVRIGLESST